MRAASGDHERETMKALSVRAPWWFAILKAEKDIENRDWKTNFRGRVLIHASKWYKHEEVMDDLWTIQRILKLDRPTENHQALLRPFGGHIVGSVEIVDCVEESDSPWFFGKYGFVLRDPIMFATPTPFKGALGFFEVPDNLVNFTREEQ